MKVTLKEAIVGIAIAVFIGIMVLPAMAGRTGSVKVTGDSGRSMVWNAMTAISNSEVLENKNGIGDQIFIGFSNDGDGAADTTISMWLQHSFDGTAPWVNVTTSASDFNSGNSETFIQSEDSSTLSYLRWHTTDVDITTANAVTPKIIVVAY